jgi:hypothetical protein
VRVGIAAQQRHWKKSMHVVHTAGVPPNHGRIRLPIIGCTRNRRNALRNVVAA